MGARFVFALLDFRQEKQWSLIEKWESTMADGATLVGRLDLGDAAAVVVGKRKQ